MNCSGQLGVNLQSGRFCDYERSHPQQKMKSAKTPGIIFLPWFGLSSGGLGLGLTR